VTTHASGEKSATASPVADSIVLLETNLDDVGGETLGFAIERLWAAGALDVATSSLAMKKNRPGVLLAVQCRPTDADALATIVLRDTTALGLRRATVSRLTLPRGTTTVQTAFGAVEGMIAILPDGGERFSPEYEACAVLAREAGAPLDEVIHAAKQAYAATKEAKEGP
jgi:uncharacterized protein (DUF111 family)